MNCHKSAYIVFVALLVFLAQGCGKKDSPAKGPAEKPVSANAMTTPSAPAPAPAKLPPATPAQVEEAVQRIFGDDVVISAAFKPHFIVGDFNGDETEDLAVVVRPVAAKLPDLNSEVANWIIQDANQFFIAPPGAKKVAPPRLEPGPVVANEDLLAVIHGFGRLGWRNPDARQAYLVKHAAAAFLGTAPSTSEKWLRDLKLPFKRDIIQADRDHQHGFLFWTGSNYAWHPSNG